MNEFQQQVQLIPPLPYLAGICKDLDLSTYVTGGNLRSSDFPGHERAWHYCWFHI